MELFNASLHFVIAFSDTKRNEAASLNSVRSWSNHFSAQYSKENTNTLLITETDTEMEFISIFFSLETLLISGTYCKISKYTIFRVSEHYSLILEQICLHEVSLSHLK